MKKSFVWILSALLILSITGCAMAEEPARVVALKGPTGIGMVEMIANPGEDWTFALAGSPDEIVSAIASASADIAAVPTNLAVTLFNKTNGNVRLLALNTLGVLHILEKGESVQSVEDLNGKTLVLTGQGAMPEYVIEYIVDQFDLDVTLEYKAEHSELATLAAAGMSDLVLLPEPFATSVLMQNADFRRALDVTELFAQAAEKAGQAGTVLSMGCLIARAEFVEQHPEQVEAFLTAYSQSVDFVLENPADAAQLVQETGILPSAAVAEKAMPGCNIVFIAGEDMRVQIEPMFQMLFDANPASIGGAMPGDDFYYVP
ncbi:MAG TPA: ABC transporter substrate-binding protein [Clostridia bacterium]|nr:ABC transporter substrate-binding protein [Clostridia bacterium]